MNDNILADACLDVVRAIRFGKRIGRTVPTSVLALSLQVACEQHDAAEAAGLLVDRAEGSS